MYVVFLPEYFVEEGGGDGGGGDEHTPWWLCAPKAVIVCPERPVGFVPFSEYDENFRYPLQSSRVPRKFAIPDDCAPCGPLLNKIEPEPDPEPETCVELVFQGGGGNTYRIPTDILTSLPSWFNEGEDFNVLYDEDDPETLTYYTADEYGYADTYQEGIQGPGEGTGIFSQGEYAICVNWFVPVPH